MPQPQKRILIDSDPGIDDAMALLLALASPELEIVGVTTVAGNNPDVGLMTRNALAILALAGRADIPVAQGAAHSLTNSRPPVGADVHGANALGGAVIAPSPRRAADATAADMIVQQARAGLDVLVALAPLTNFALALDLCPELNVLAPRLSIMGGALAVPGNATPTAEANILNDPEAARQVFAAWPEIIMAGLDITRQVVVDAEELRRWRDLGNKAGRFLHDAAQHYLHFYQDKGERGLHMHDVHAIMVLLRPDLYTVRQVCVDVETVGELTRGQTVADWRGHWQRKQQTTMLFEVDADAFMEEYAARIATLP